MIRALRILRCVAVIAVLVCVGMNASSAGASDNGWWAPVAHWSLSGIHEQGFSAGAVIDMGAPMRVSDVKRSVIRRSACRLERERDAIVPVRIEIENTTTDFRAKVGLTISTFPADSRENRASISTAQLSMRVTTGLV